MACDAIAVRKTKAYYKSGSLAFPMLSATEIPTLCQQHLEAHLISTSYHCTTHKGQHGIDGDGELASEIEWKPLNQ
ncbi:MAG: hypothetical protein RIS79_2044 [Verrucomicrobiota bacterium]|jgi:hypothetical protein